jgi:hypothetical protein
MRVHSDAPKRRVTRALIYEEFACNKQSYQ